MSHRAIHSRLSARLLPALLFLALLLAVLWGGARLFAPRSERGAVGSRSDYDSRPLQQAVAPARVRAELDHLRSFGSRFLGQPGMAATADYLRERYRAAGLEVHEQENWTVVPRTEFREIYAVGPDDNGPGKLLRDVAIYPFMPNHLQPVTTPDEGITGELLLLTSATLRTRTQFNDCIGLLDPRDGAHDPDFAFDWRRYAQLGLRALIVAHPAGLGEVPWDRVADNKSGMVASTPINFVRLAADGNIFAYVGQTIRVRVRVRFERVRHDTIIGILRAGTTTAKQPNDHALALLTNYDAASILPDRAPGTAQAMGVAAQLALLDGLAPYRDQLARDVVFVAFGGGVMARDGDANLLRILDENLMRAEDGFFERLFGGRAQDDSAAGTSEAQNAERSARWATRRAENLAASARVARLLKLFEDPDFMRRRAAPGPTAGLQPGDAGFLEQQLRYVLQSIVFELSEPVTQAKLAFMRAGEVVQGEPFRHYQQLKQVYDRAVSLVSSSPARLFAAENHALLDEHRLRERMLDRLHELETHHARLTRQAEKDLDTLAALQPYRELIVIDNKLVPAYSDDDAAETLTFTNGEWVVSPQMRAVTSLFSAARQRLTAMGLGSGLEALSIPQLSKWHSQDVDTHTLPISDRSSVMWTRFGYLIYTLINFNRSQSYRHLNDPVDAPWMRDVDSIARSLAVAGETILSVAQGNGDFPPIQLGWLKNQFGGRVLASGVGQSLVPDFPLKNAVLAARSREGYGQYAWPGFYNHPLLMTDPYGRYELINASQDFWIDQYTWAYGYSPVAAWHGRDGLIQWIKDEGDDGQRLYKSVNLNWFDARVSNINLVAFRAAPVALLDMINPQTMRDFNAMRLVSRDGLAAFRKECQFQDDGLRVSYIEPTQNFYALLEAGSSENERAREIRAFMLGQSDPNAAPPQRGPRREIDGPGYLAADTPLLLGAPQRAAGSMLQVNDRRLAVQNRYGIADAMTRQYQERARTLLDSAGNARLPYQQTLQAARQSLTYSLLNHPILRRTVWEAVIGILYYLALLVPFVFFAERLLFGFTDVRKQLAAQLVLFLIVFGLLRWMHPAFTMVRSSLMILLGFVVMMISGGMTLLFSDRFRENLEELRRRRGQVDAAEANRMGVFATSFALGLNNLSRRRLRTGLTCATLTLMTFAMISFTSVRSDIVEKATALGKATYPGLLIKREQFRRITDAELFAIQARFGSQYAVASRRMHLGVQNWLDNQGYNPELEVSVQHEGRRRSASASALLQFSAAEPLRTQLRFLGPSTWFTAADERATTQACPILISGEVANELGLAPEQVAASGGTPVMLNGRSFVVRGVFDAASFGALRDLDGRDLLPYDVSAMSGIQMQEEEIIATDADPRIDPRRVILAPMRKLALSIPNAREIISSVAVDMSATDYKTTRETISAYLEQTGRVGYYGLDGVAYRGERRREGSLAGLLDMLIPLLIAGLTVLNTMKGSVYERRGEIFVYNAVGIAPRQVFLMFFAEAFVYAVIGSVLGYLLSQGVGRFLMATGLTGGMTMSFTSIHSIYASLAMTLAVFVSTWFPARSALEIAKPAEEAGWKLPEPEGRQLAFDLPFTFNHRDRVAVLAFCEAYLLDHGEGGGGLFQASPPAWGLQSAAAPTQAADVVPRLSTTIWIKPFDLGVSQRLELTLPHDPETEEYKAHIVLTQLSGTREAWLRLNQRFVAQLRRQFLHWRAVDASQRTRYFAEAREHLQRSAQPEHA